MTGWRGSAASRGYDAAWRKLREAKLAADPLCWWCLQQGISDSRRTPSTTSFRSRNVRPCGWSGAICDPAANLVTTRIPHERPQRGTAECAAGQAGPFGDRTDMVADQGWRQVVSRALRETLQRATVADGRARYLFAGSGAKIVLRTFDARAMFVWREYVDSTIPVQTGVECSVFRNEAPETWRSSELVRQADAIADRVWPGQRHYTKVRASAIRGSNPGCCFKQAGWRSCGMTKGGLHLLERVI